MTTIRLFVLAIVFYFAGSVLSTAEAADVFEGPAYIDLLPVGEIVGDGKASSTLNVLALQPDGQPLTGLSLKASSNQGKASEWIEIGGGLYTFSYTASPVDTNATAQITLKGRTPNREVVNLSFEVPVNASTKGPISVSPSPDVLTAGQQSEASVTFQIENGKSAADLDVRAVHGTIQNVTHLGSGSHRALYTPPAVNFPHLGIITVSDRANPNESYGYHAMPLSGRVNYPVQVRPNASVMLTILDRTFGPVQANAEGKASVPIVVPPGISKATLISVVNDSRGEEVIDLKVPEKRRIEMFSPPATIPANPQTTVNVRAVVLTATGKPDETAKVIFSTTAGKVSEAQYEGNGIYVAQYSPPASNNPIPATIEAQIAGSTVQIATREVQIIPVRPTMMMMSAEPAELPVGSTALKVFLKLLDANGTGIAGKDVNISATGAKLKEIRDIGNGDYRVDFSAASGNSVLVRANVVAAASSNAMRHILLVPSANRVTNDGLSSVAIGLLTVDEFGYPVPGVKVSLSNPKGQGSLPQEVTTDPSGTAQFFYTSGQKPGIVTIRAEADGLAGEAGLLQAPADVPELYLAPSGTQNYIMHQVSWSEIMRTLSIARETSEEQVAAMEANTDPRTDATSDGVIASIELSVSPATTVPGGQITVNAKALDAQGRGVAGKALDFLTSAGTFGSPTDYGGGDYQITLTVAETAKDEVKVHVSAPSGVMAMAKLELTEAAAEQTAPTTTWGAIEEPATTSEPQATADSDSTTTGTDTAEATAGTEKPQKPKKEKAPKSSASDDTWFRASVAGALASYRYEQSPSAAPGPLLPQTLAVGKEYGGKNAGSAGFEGRARVWLPQLRYLGFSGHGRATGYAIEAAEFNGTANDWLYDLAINVNGRVPFDVAEHTFWIGAEVGMRFTDFMVFKGCLEVDCEVFFEPLPLPGLGLGIEAGADIGDDLFAVFGFSQSLAYVTVPYLMSLDAEIGYHVTDNIFVNIGFIRQTRSLSLEGQDSGLERGELSDGQTIGTAGVGFAF